MCNRREKGFNLSSDKTKDKWVDARNGDRRTDENKIGEIHYEENCNATYVGCSVCVRHHSGNGISD